MNDKLNTALLLLEYNINQLNFKNTNNQDLYYISQKFYLLKNNLENKQYSNYIQNVSDFLEIYSLLFPEITNLLFFILKESKNEISLTIVSENSKIKKNVVCFISEISRLDEIFEKFSDISNNLPAIIDLKVQLDLNNINHSIMFSTLSYIENKITMKNDMLRAIDNLIEKHYNTQN